MERGRDRARDRERDSKKKEEKEKREGEGEREREREREMHTHTQICNVPAGSTPSLTTDWLQQSRNSRSKSMSLLSEFNAGQSTKSSG